ncbi:hypothetical protein M2322_003537 [Rhodoblastus acidophilus]|uniref:hypothetical protein n=1 Tax=Rhodoblastus acidophilus TaxID=1074 RepID=UPI002224F63A|nr:hypothetical protein [Rhodoblastus acidophilus]MCW2317972.1 hypothetical protein [Rhodoblastus acidophilus]
MAFVRIIEETTFQSDVFRDGNEWAVIINIGYDDELPLNYSLVVGLSPMAGGDLEYYFYMVEADSANDREEIYWCAQRVARLVPAEDRVIVLGSLLTATKALLDNARPERFDMVTRDANPPEKALVKYHLIGSVFEACGYNVNVADPWHGKRIWWMERQGAAGR